MNPIYAGLYTNRRIEIIEIGYFDRFNISFCIMHWYMLFSISRFCIRIDILPALEREDSHGTAPLSWDIVVYDVTRS